MKLVLHERAQRALKAIEQRPAGSYVFHGPVGVGKATAAIELARRLCCGSIHDDTARCAVCAQFAAGTYPDLILVAPTDKPSLTIEQIRGVVSALAMQPYYPTGHRVVIIDNANALTTDAANALLKLLEEPPPRTLFILVTPAVEKLLPTVRSRCLNIFFPLPPLPDTQGLLTSRGIDATTADRITQATAGAPGLSLQLAADEKTAASYLELAAAAATVPTASRFKRLQLAAKLASTTSDAVRFGRLLQDRFTAAAREGTSSPTTTAKALHALEAFRRQLSAKVSPRVALERLMLELPS